MVKKRKSDSLVEKQRNGIHHERMENFINKKEEEKLEKGMIAREDALKAAGIKQEYNYADHQHIYNYADDRDGAPIKTLGYNIAKCKQCSFLKDGNLPEEQQCRCDWTARGWRSPPPSPPPSPKPSRKRASPCPSTFKVKHDPRDMPAARNHRAAKVFEKSMAAAGK
jgi:hypothetical protein